MPAARGGLVEGKYSMSLARWEHEYSAHNAWHLLDDLQTAVNSRATQDSDGQACIDRLRMLVSLLGDLRLSPSPLVSQAALQRLAQSLTELINSLTPWVNQGSLPLLMQAATKYTDAVLDAANGWAGVPRELGGSAGLLDQFANESREELQRIRGETEEYQGYVRTVTAELQERQEASVREVAVVIREADKARSQVEAQVRRLDAALNGVQEAFTTAEAERARDVRESLSAFEADKRAQLQEVEQQAEAARQAQLVKFDMHLQKLQEHEQSAANLVSAIGLTGTATEYGTYATEQRNIANGFRWLALGLFLTAFLLFLITVLRTPISSVTPWQFVVLRVVGSVALLAGGGYAARESTRHRGDERRARATQLMLTALDPFIANLSGEQQEVIKADAARTLVSGSTPDTAKPNASKRSELPQAHDADVGAAVKMVTEVIRNLTR